MGLWLAMGGTFERVGLGGLLGSEPWVSALGISVVLFGPQDAEASPGEVLYSGAERCCSGLFGRRR